MNVEKTGENIAQARKKIGMTQEELAERIGVSVQAVSKWECGKNLPDIENLMQIAEITNTPYSILFGVDENGRSMENTKYRSRIFHEENMFTRMRSFALSEHLTETYKALSFMREKHLGQFRKKSKFTQELVQYINHPLMMACQAHALGVRDDCLLSAILLHDVVEDTDTLLDELPFPDEVKELVDLVTFSVPECSTKEAAKELYYHTIQENGKACVIKIIDRCNNVSTMSASFSRAKMLNYIDETEKYILPLTDILKNEYPEYSDLAFLIKYQIISIIETVKSLIIT
ncbi:MAG: helix-turn-helix domain-containing protein [Clostridia bacterium]|nr:helix-turn-helix domain-containing protein [Clostridia bacterium]